MRITILWQEFLSGGGGGGAGPRYSFIQYNIPKYQNPQLRADAGVGGGGGGGGAFPVKLKDKIIIIIIIIITYAYIRGYDMALVFALVTMVSRWLF